MIYKVKTSKKIWDTISGVKFYQVLYNKKDSRFGQQVYVANYGKEKTLFYLWFEEESRGERCPYLEVHASFGFSMEIRYISEDLAVKMAIAATKEYLKNKKVTK